MSIVTPQTADQMNRIRSQLQALGVVPIRWPSVGPSRR